MDIVDVAKALKVSVATVSRALNPATAHLVAEKTRKKVLTYADEIGYVPNRSARALSSGMTYTIGLVLPNVLESIFFNDYFIKVLAGVYRVLEEQPKYSCRIIVLPRGKVLSNLDREVSAAGLDGLLLSPYCDPALYGADFPKTLLKKWQKPIVGLNLSPERVPRFSTIYTNHRDGAKRAVTYLIQKGHKKIAMIQGDHVFPEALERFEGYREALSDHGFEATEDLVERGGFLIEGGYNAALKLFRGGRRDVTAVFCANDEMAVGVIRALKTLGLKCPNDVAVVGFDGIDLGEFLEPRLTTMAQPTREIAENSTRLLLDLVQEKNNGPVTRAIPSQLLVRESA